MRGACRPHAGAARRAAPHGSVPRAVPLAGVARVSPRSASMRLLSTLCATALLCAAAARRSDQDFEFDDDAAEQEQEVSASDNSVSERRPRRYVHDPHNALCGALVCAARELCLLRDAYTALCAYRNDILRQGDVIVSAGAAEDDLDDVFYEAGGGGGAGAGGGAGGGGGAGAGGGGDADAADRCVGCGPSAGAGAGGAGSAGEVGFLCGSDNRTYSSLCRLDLHNCVRRAARPPPPARAPAPVRLACRGYCPCRAPPPRRRRPHTNRIEWRRRKAEPEAGADADAGAGVGASRPARRRLTGGSGCALDKMANRLLDWFSVLMEGAGGRPPPRGAPFPAECKAEVRWMFRHLDGDGDGLVSARELYALRHAERERCLRPFLARCGGTRAAWCACLARAARPCAALARAHAQDAARGGYAPACDARGYYAPRQCHAALAVCWCVDKHGAERPGSRTRGHPDCTPPAPGAGGAPTDDEDAGGSGDAEPVY